MGVADLCLYLQRLAQVVYGDPRAVHPEKDQSYVLCHLTQEQLSMLRLPLGEYSKPEIRALAKESGLVVAQKPDSQDIC